MFSCRQLILALSLFSLEASAGGFYSGRFGNQHGHAASRHVTSTYYNPAGISFLRGNHLYLEGIAALRFATYERDVSAIDNLGGATPTNAADANAGEASLTNIIASPFLGFTTDLGSDNFTLGFSASVPFGGQAKWDTNDAYAGNTTHPGAVDGVQRWANIEGSQRAIYLTTAAAWKLPEANLAFGFGFNVISQSVETIRARTALGTDDLATGTGSLLEGRSHLKADGLTYSLSAGVQWQPTEALRVGASYQSQPGLGSTRQEGVLTNKFGTGTTTPTPVWLEQELPDIARVAVEYEKGAWQFRVAADWQRWSVMKNQCLMNLNIADRKCALNPDGSVDAASGGKGVTVVLPRDWQDTFGVMLGATLQLNPGMSLYGSALFDTNAVPDETLDAALMDMNKINAQFGMSWNMTDSLILNTALNGVAYLPRETEARAIDPLPPSRNPDNAGKYSQFIGYLTIGVEYAF